MWLKSPDNSGGFLCHLVEEVHAHWWQMLDSGAICPSQSVWCNAVVLVWKKDGSLCFCINFCCLNAHTKKDSYPLPRIQEALESLVGAGHFSCLDLKSGFWHLKMDKLSKQYTMFTIGNLGFFKGNCMPFGLCSAPATFQRLMQNCLGELNLTYCLIYLEDIIVFLQMAMEHSNAYMSSLTNLESITWSWNHPSVTFAGTKLPP